MAGETGNPLIDRTLKVFTEEFGPTSAHEVYPADKGRHSGTNAVPGLEGGKPAVKLIVESETALAEAVQYIKARARM